MKKKKNNSKKNTSFIIMVIFLFLIFLITRSWLITGIFGVIIITMTVYFNTPVGKGKIGEFLVRILIGKNNPRKDTYSIHNLTFFDGSKSVQVDHLVINKQGIHVIETKNYAGFIYGDDYQKQWTQVLAYGKVKHKLFNPIHQNYGHIMSLSAVLNIDTNAFHSYIVFTGRAKLMIECKTPVLYPIDIKKNIKSNSMDVFLKNDVMRIYEILLNMKKSNTISNKEHIKSINERINE